MVFRCVAVLLAQVLITPLELVVGEGWSAKYLLLLVTSLSLLPAGDTFGLVCDPAFLVVESDRFSY